MNVIKARWADLQKMRGTPVWSALMIFTTTVLILYRVYGLGFMSSESPCSLQQTSSSNYGEEYAYKYLVHRSKAKHAPLDVALVTLTPYTEPPDVLSNVCDSRKFFSLLLPALADLHVRALVIDKYYSDGACPSDRPENAELRNAIQTIPANIPLIVGQAVQRDSTTSDAKDTCLAPMPVFDFLKDLPVVRRKVLYGLTRLNENALQIPLAWPVADRGETSKAYLQPGLALQAAEQVPSHLLDDPAIRAASGKDLDVRHPFGLLRTDLPHWSAMDIVCAKYGPDGLKEHDWNQYCAVPHRDAEGLRDKVVVIGEHVDHDLKALPGGESFGVDLQAEYIDALLTGNYLKEFPWWMELIILASGLALLGYLEHWLDKRSNNSELWKLKAYSVGVGMLLLALCFTSYALLSREHLYTPLILFSLWPVTLTLLVRGFTHFHNTTKNKVFTAEGAS